MGLKLLLLAGVCVATLWVLGFGPAELQRLASNAANSTANAIAPGGNDAGWARPG